MLALENIAEMELEFPSAAAYKLGKTNRSRLNLTFRSKF